MAKALKGEKHPETCITNHALIKLIIIHSLQRQGRSWHALIVRPCAGVNEEHEESVEAKPSAEGSPSAKKTPSTKVAPNVETTPVAETTTSSKRKTTASSKKSSEDTPPMIGQKNPMTWSSIRTTPLSSS